jgi:membrane associated rhomboid family serine protease
MGIQDRDYYRNEGPSILDSVMPRGVVCRWLIGINVAVFFLQMAAVSMRVIDPASNRDVVTSWLALDVHKVLDGQIWRLVTYSFLHSTEPIYFHILFNMLFLWWFGSDVEQLYGRKEFLAIYLVSALLGGIAYEAWGLTQINPGYCIGASGAVTTMLVLCALHFPRRLIYLFGIAPIPIWLFAIFNVLGDLAGMFGIGDKGVAFSAHLAGAAFAVAYYQWQRSIVEFLRGFLWWKGSRQRVRLKLFNPDEDREEPVAVSANSAPTLVVDEHLEAKLDAVLEKIAKTGKESLTPKEEEVLKQAAEMYKRRRN